MPAAPQSAGRLPLLRAAHIGPGLAVTAGTALLAVRQDLRPVTVGILTAAVLSGQLTIGWANDLLDAARDRAVGRRDKPLASGEVSRRLVLGCLAVAGLACAVLSPLVGWRSGVVHLGLGVASGHAYNLWLKATAWSWLPYAVAFGALPAAVSLAGGTPHWPPVWMVLTAAVIGVAAHLLNALPDLADDLATGVRGLPHRLGPTAARLLAAGLLLAGSAVAVLGPPGPASSWAWTALLAAAVLAVVAVKGQGKLPFHAAIGVALVDVVLLVTVGR
ncbi:MAG TPA: UbiA family prenyltransferase [Marmoricola sp.]|nr:UbiA family prenyltransferase [Marmoricola sp.]